MTMSRWCVVLQCNVHLCYAVSLGRLRRRLCCCCNRLLHGLLRAWCISKVYSDSAVVVGGRRHEPRNSCAGTQRAKSVTSAPGTPTDREVGRTTQDSDDEDAVAHNCAQRVPLLAFPEVLGSEVRLGGGAASRFLCCGRCRGSTAGAKGRLLSPRRLLCCYNDAAASPGGSWPRGRRRKRATEFWPQRCGPAACMHPQLHR